MQKRLILAGKTTLPPFRRAFDAGPSLASKAGCLNPGFPTSSSRPVPVSVSPHMSGQLIDAKRGPPVGWGQAAASTSRRAFLLPWNS